MAIINNSEVTIVVLVVEFGDIFGVRSVVYFCDGGVSPVVVFGIELAADAACYVVYDVVGVVVVDVVVVDERVGMPINFYSGAIG